MTTPVTAQVIPETDIAPSARAEHASPSSYRLRRLDTFSWAIERRRTRKDGTPGGWAPDGYFPRLEIAAQRLFDRLLLDGDELRSVEELIRAVREARDFIALTVGEIE